MILKNIFVAPGAPVTSGGKSPVYTKCRGGGGCFRRGSTINFKKSWRGFKIPPADGGRSANTFDPKGVPVYAKVSDPSGVSVRRGSPWQRRTPFGVGNKPVFSFQKMDFLKYKKLIKLKQALMFVKKKLKISRKIFSKKVFVKTMHRKLFDYTTCGITGIYPIKPIHFETSYKLMISIFLFSPQKLSLLSPTSGHLWTFR